MAVASFSLAPDAAVDLAWKLGLSLRWLVQDTNGGSSAMNMLGHALRGVETGAARTILVVGGDATGLGGYAKVAANFNIVTQLHLAPLGHGGPNGVYALVTSRQMKKYGLQKSDYGQHRHRAARLGGEQPLRGLSHADDHGGVSRRAVGGRSAVALRLRAGGRRRAGDRRGASRPLPARPRARAGARASHELQLRQPGGRRAADRHQHLRRRAVAGRRRAAGAHRRGLHLRRLSHHGAGAGSTTSA